MGVRGRRQSTEADVRTEGRGLIAWRRVAGALLPVVVTLTVGVSPALGSRQQLAMFEDDTAIQAQPDATLDTLRQLGVGLVRVYVKWSSVAPQPGSTRRPAGFKAINPAAYPARNWAVFDTIVRAAVARGLQVDLTPSSPGPVWANGPGAPRANSVLRDWMPSAREFGAFVRALGTRYSGYYRPPGASTPLPRVSFWDPWNEPNFGKGVAPQASNGTLASPMMYRALLDAGWSALRVSGHGRDMILIGNLDARGTNLPGTYGATKPEQFMRALYCLDSRYRQLRGVAAQAVKCPTTAAASRGFRAAHPALFAATGVAVHPYPVNLPPTQATSNDPDFVEFDQIPALSRNLDRIQRAYRSSKSFPIYVNEYGYITNPPNHSSNHFVSPPTAAYYTNWTEYLSWLNPRIATTMQFLLVDPNPRVNVPEYGGFASGLEFFGGVRKPSFDAYRLPLYLPSTSTSAGGSLEVWGAARPARYAAVDSGQPQTVEIQYESGLTGTFTTIKTIPITDPGGYFDVRVAFPSSGSVRLAYTYPGPIGQTVFSRPQRITVG